MTEKTWHSLTPEQTVNDLSSDSGRGLTPAEAENRLKQYGPNELVKEKHASPFVIFLNQFKNILVIILLVAIALSVAIGEGLDAAIIGVIVLFVAILGFVQEYRAERALDALKKMLSPSITVFRAGVEEEVPTSSIVPGDIIYLEAGDKVPADCRILEAHAFKCDESSLTGESFSVDKSVPALAGDIPVAERKNMVFAGTVVTYGRAKVIVTATAMTTEFGRIAREMMTVKTEKTPLEKRTQEIGKWLSLTALIICGLVIGISLIREALVGTIHLKFVVEILMFGIALAVAAVPEALPAIVTGALAVGMHEMAKRNALIRKMPAVETLGCTTVICTDKTGTLTRGEMTIRKIYLPGQEISVMGVGYEPKGEFKSDKPFDPKTGRIASLLTAGLLCNDSDLFEKDSKWQIKGDSTEAALLVLAAKAGMNVPETRLQHPREDEIPFSSERKRMTTIHDGAAGGRKACMKGAAEMVLERCGFLVDASSGVRAITEADRADILRRVETMAGEALRVLGLASRDLPPGAVIEEESVEKDMVFLGMVGMIDPARPEVIEAIRTCRSVKIKPVMITGDHQLTAVAIAKEVGIFIDGDLSLTGQELAAIPDEKFAAMVDKVSVYARVSPMDKLKIVRAWKARGEVVAMTGDGVNDAPALKHADIGVAMGITGTEVTKEAADMVLTDDNFATIVKAIELGRWIYDNIKKYLTYLMRCNITEVVIIGGVVVFMGPSFLPLLPAAILYINLATDGLPALALGVAPPDPDIMRRPPRNPKESVFSFDVRAFIWLALFIEIPFFLFLFFHDLKSIDTARTEIFFAFIIVELVLALNFRSMRFSIFKAPPHKWLLLSLLWEILLVVGLVQIPGLRASFGIHLPTLGQIGLILGFSVIVFLSMEAVKFYLRRKFKTAVN